MKNNIIQKHSLKEYNKRYRHHKNLLKFTKKEVEEFDREANTIGEHYVLRKYKWWFIDDTYYQVPKTLHHYWFRNLNAGVQTAICLLGAGVIATGASLPFILKLGQTVEPSITITGAEYDKDNSHIELNKESTIALKKHGTEDIKGIEYVKVGDNTLTEAQYSFNSQTKVVTIKAEAMTSTKIEIKVKTKNPHVVDLETWIEKANKLNADYLSSTLEYTLEQITKYVEDNEEKTLTSVKYINEPEEGREFWVYFGGGGGTAVVSSKYSGNSLLENGCITDKGICEIYDDEIVYKNENAGDDEYKELHINKFGYPTYELYGDGTFYEIRFNSEPKTPTHVVTKAEWIEKANELVLISDEALCNSKLEYKQSQLTYKVNNEVKQITNFDYTGNGEERLLTGRVDGEDIEFASCHYSGTYLDETLHELSDDGVYEIHDDEIVYKNENAGEQNYKELHINKYGYPIYELSGGGDLYETIWEGNPEIYYNIDWATSNFDLGVGGQRTLYESAKTANKIEFVKDSTAGGICVGEIDGDGNREPVYAALDLIGTDLTLKLWSVGQIRFNDDDYGDDGFFFGCDSVSEFDFSNIDTSKVTDFSCCFEGCSKTTSLDLTNFDTFNAQYMDKMFKDCEELEFINNILFNTAKVETMDEMFRKCKKITSLDVSRFDTTNVTMMTNMFRECNELITIYATDKFITTSVEDSEDMFYQSEKLVGGKGTIYDSEHVTCEYARIDDPDNSNPGYFTSIEPTLDKLSFFNPSESEPFTCEVKAVSTDITNAIVIPNEVDGSMCGCAAGTKYKVTKIADDGFKGITGITSLLTPSSITSIGSNAFNGCTGLSSVTLNEGLVEIMKYGFKGTKIKNINMPDSVQLIGMHAFKDIKIERVYISNKSNLNEIAMGAFSGSHLTSFYIPRNVTKLGGNCIVGADSISLTLLVIDSPTIAVMDDPGNLFMLGGWETGGEKTIKIPKDTVVGHILANSYEKQSPEGNYDIYINKGC